MFRSLYDDLLMPLVLGYANGARSDSPAPKLSPITFPSTQMIWISTKNSPGSDQARGDWRLHVRTGEREVQQTDFKNRSAARVE